MGGIFLSRLLAFAGLLAAPALSFTVSARLVTSTNADVTNDATFRWRSDCCNWNDFVGSSTTAAPALAVLWVEAFYNTGRHQISVDSRADVTANFHTILVNFELKDADENPLTSDRFFRYNPNCCNAVTMAGDSVELLPRSTDWTLSVVRYGVTNSKPFSIAGLASGASATVTFTATKLTIGLKNSSGSDPYLKPHSFRFKSDCCNWETTIPGVVVAPFSHELWLLPNTSPPYVFECRVPLIEGSAYSSHETRDLTVSSTDSSDLTMTFQMVQTVMLGLDSTGKPLNDNEGPVATGLTITPSEPTFGEDNFNIDFSVTTSDETTGERSIYGGEYKLDGQSWSSISATFPSSVEEVLTATFAPTPLDVGSHTLCFRGIDVADPAGPDLSEGDGIFNYLVKVDCCNWVDFPGTEIELLPGDYFDFRADLRFASLFSDDVVLSNPTIVTFHTCAVSIVLLDGDGNEVTADLDRSYKTDCCNWKPFGDDFPLELEPKSIYDFRISYMNNQAVQQDVSTCLPYPTITSQTVTFQARDVTLNLVTQATEPAPVTATEFKYRIGSSNLFSLVSNTATSTSTHLPLNNHIFRVYYGGYWAEQTGVDNTAANVIVNFFTTETTLELRSPTPAGDAVFAGSSATTWRYKVDCCNYFTVTGNQLELLPNTQGVDFEATFNDASYNPSVSTLLKDVQISTGPTQTVIIRTTIVTFVLQYSNTSPIILPGGSYAATYQFKLNCCDAPKTLPSRGDPNTAEMVPRTYERLIVTCTTSNCLVGGGACSGACPSFELSDQQVSGESTNIIFVTTFSDPTGRRRLMSEASEGDDMRMRDLLPSVVVVNKHAAQAPAPPPEEPKPEEEEEEGKEKDAKNEREGDSQGEQMMAHVSSPAPEAHGRAILEHARELHGAPTPQPGNTGEEICLDFEVVEIPCVEAPDEFCADLGSDWSDQDFIDNCGDFIECDNIHQCHRCRKKINYFECERTPALDVRCSEVPIACTDLADSPLVGERSSSTIRTCINVQAEKPEDCEESFECSEGSFWCQGCVADINPNEVETRCRAGGPQCSVEFPLCAGAVAPLDSKLRSKHKCTNLDSDVENCSDFYQCNDNAQMYCFQCALFNGKCTVSLEDVCVPEPVDPSVPQDPQERLEEFCSSVVPPVFVATTKTRSCAALSSTDVSKDFQNNCPNFYECPSTTFAFCFPCEKAPDRDGCRKGLVPLPDSISPTPKCSATGTIIDKCSDISTEVASVCTSRFECDPKEFWCTWCSFEQKTSQCKAAGSICDPEIEPCSVEGFPYLAPHSPDTVFPHTESSDFRCEYVDSDVSDCGDFYQCTRGSAYCQRCQSAEPPLLVGRRRLLQNASGELAESGPDTETDTKDSPELNAGCVASTVEEDKCSFLPLCIEAEPPIDEISEFAKSAALATKTSAQVQFIGSRFGTGSNPHVNIKPLTESASTRSVPEPVPRPSLAQQHRQPTRRTSSDPTLIKYLQRIAAGNRPHPLG